ncbi:hypothetical protein Moror_8610 [Moniliophthora roreri MCA 2997]|uniref:Uncharacterized protein n=1 Tax=Moniliophthora roreri (strain MCA 2997) TaxID=1381753 RepID=V2YD88_MONRO|nr:hypothetical protein Moror_8610 [Moniliophthora roreri MCA 2997]
MGIQRGRSDNNKSPYQKTGREGALAMFFAPFPRPRALPRAPDATFAFEGLESRACGEEQGEKKIFRSSVAQPEEMRRSNSVVNKPSPDPSNRTSVDDSVFGTHASFPPSPLHVPEPLPQNLPLVRHFFSGTRSYPDLRKTTFTFKTKPRRVSGSFEKLHAKIHPELKMLKTLWSWR